jgi:L-threonylcarbamoyladenylate synthase
MVSSRRVRTTIDEAVKILKKGGVVAYPTDTSYGLAVDATNLKAVKKLYQLKARNFKNPIHIIVPYKRSHDPYHESIWLKKIVRVNKTAEVLMEKFWPGSLTLVLPLKSRDRSWHLLSAGTKSLGIRQPNNRIALELVKKFNKPITTTSANVSGQENCYSVEEVKRQFQSTKKRLLRRLKAASQWTSEPDYYLDGGKLKKIKPSTVVSLMKDVKILREGPISERKIKLIINNVSKQISS